MAAQCGPNAIVCENQLPGNDPSEWDVVGAGDASLQGFATDISVNKGGTVHFKIDTTASTLQIDVYRLGYYGGLGARRVATLADIPGFGQPGCLTDTATGLVDCGNWSESAAWTVPSTAVSGIYLARLSRSDTGGASHIAFVVRDDAAQSTVLFQTSDTTWQAYNQYGGNSLYVGGPAGRAYKVSYNRPFTTRGTGPEDWLFNAEYPMVRWLEANGYDVSYFTGTDSDRFGATELLRHRIFLSVGHDEYWSGTQRANVEAARGAGVHLAFFSGNEVFWKTRWEPSIDGSGTPYRTLVAYKETHANAVIDPSDPPTWTGAWRDPRFSPPGDGGRPENALTGTLFTVNCCNANATIRVSQDFASEPFWRNTRVAELPIGGTTTLTANVLGYEWDENLTNGFQPPDLATLSSTTLAVNSKLQDYGSTFAPDTATHSLTLYRHSSGALVFGAGTVQWSWGLDGSHDRGGSMPDLAMEQATVNLFFDMGGVQPGSLQPGLVPASPVIETMPPSSTITSPASGTSVAAGTSVVIAGTASDARWGQVANVQVSTDNGATWHIASGTTAWSYVWTPGIAGPTTVKSRAIDDSGNIENPSAGVSVTVTGATCPCRIWNNSTTPSRIETSDTNAVELGVRFRADVDGTINSLRFYKGSANTGVHIGNLWTSSGTRLATATFTNETASGWQQIELTPPVAIAANTTYVASYHTTVGNYGADNGYFTSGVDSAPLHALADDAGGGNGVYLYGAGGFPTETYQASNYWVDVVFSPTIAIAVPNVVTLPQTNAAAVLAGAGLSLGTVTAAPSSTVAAGSVINQSPVAGTPVAAGSAVNLAVSSGPSAVTVPNVVALTQAAAAAAITGAGLTVGPVTSAPSPIVPAGSVMSQNPAAGTPLAAGSAVNLTVSSGPATSGCPCSIWTPAATPGAQAADPNAVELGVKFTADNDGVITGLRFYKYDQNTGTHVGHLWTIAGTLLGTATFANETASGWQQASFAQPDRHHGEYDLHRVVSHEHGLLRVHPAGLLHRRGSRAAPCPGGLRQRRQRRLRV